MGFTGIGLLTFVLSYSFPLFGEVRKWTDVQGRVIEAELIKFEDGIVHIRLKSGKIGNVPLEKLSADDQAFVKKTIQPPANNPTPPPAVDPPEMSEEKWPNFRGLEPPSPFADWVYPKGTGKWISIDQSKKFFTPDGEILFDEKNIVSHAVDYSHGYATVKYINPDNSWSPRIAPSRMTPKERAQKSW